MLRWLLVVLLVGLAAACGPLYGRSYDSASAVAEGSASLGVGEAIKVTATVRMDDVAGRVREDDNLPAPRGGEDATIAFNVRSSGTTRSAEGIHGGGTENRLVGLPGNFEGRGGNHLSELSVGGFDPSLECRNGTCEGDIVMYALPRANDEVLRGDNVVPPDTEIPWPVETEWKLTASVSSAWRLADNPVEIEVVAQEIVAGYAWEATTQVDFDFEAALPWQAVHFTIDLPPDTLPHPGSELSAWAAPYQSYGSYDVLDEGTVAISPGGRHERGIMCESVDGCDSLGYARLFRPSTRVGLETVTGGANGLRFEGDSSTDSSTVAATATASATATVRADQAVRTTFSGTLDGVPSSSSVDFSISLASPGHTDGWPVIVYIVERKRSGESDLTESTGEMVLTDCRRTPCSGEFSLYSQHEPPFEWEIEAVVVPWSNEDTEGIEIEVAPLP